MAACLLSAKQPVDGAPKEAPPEAVAPSKVTPPSARSAAANLPDTGERAKIFYQLPLTGPLPKTYRVTLAITHPKNLDWIVSTFASGVVRTVTAQNQGRFTETWDGLDDNFMPVAAGTYGVKGIYMPAQKWRVDGEFHSVTPRFVGGVSPWLPSPADWRKPMPFGGDPIGAPLRDVAVGSNGVAVFYYQYLENGTNNPLIDLKQPLGPGQLLRAFNSGGAAGGTSVTTDGQTVWAFSTDGGPKYVYRADEQSFGSSPGANRTNAYLPAGWVTAMANWRDPKGRSFVYLAQRGKIVPGNGDYIESTTDFVDKITVLDGKFGAVFDEITAPRPQGLAVQGHSLFVLHRTREGADVQGWMVSETALSSGRIGGLTPLFTVPASINPFDLEVDSHGRFYLSDPAANKVYQLDRSGKVLRTYGRLAAQKPGTYDPLTLMAPGKLATWTDSQGNDRLLIVENAGPNRTGEWSADGKLLREFASFQTQANDGYTFDPADPRLAYIMGQGGWLSCYRVDADKGTWTLNAVWPNVGTDPRAPGLEKPQFIRVGGRSYLAGEKSHNIYRLDGNRWLLSSAILHETRGNTTTTSLWHDANGDGRVEQNETMPTAPPGNFFGYHGQNWGSDLSFLALNIGGRDLWRLAPEGFDAHGNPIFKTWRKVLTDPVLQARPDGSTDATHGGNELDSAYSSDWAQAVAAPGGDYYVQARGGVGFDANHGAQFKISRYVPARSGGAYRLKWRVGRAALQGVAGPGELYGAMRLHPPLNGLLGVIDQTRMGVVLYTVDGLYVDTLFPDQRRFPPSQVGLYAQPAEYFAGSIVPNRLDGKIYLALGKFTPLLFAVEGWSLTQNPTHPLTTVQKTVTVRAAQMATPPEVALALRGGAGMARVARFTPALGGVALDGSMNGWNSSRPLSFGADQNQSVEVRTLYDPQHLYLRWHARLGTTFEPKPLPPAERVFTHDQGADTLSLYFQGDPQARPGGAAGRPGDVRIVFGLFKNGPDLQPIAVGFYPSWKGPGAHAQIYRTPVGQTRFAQVGPIADAQLGYKLDDDGKGFVLAAAIPRAAIPDLRQEFNSSLRTLVNFEATFGGHNKFWWANSDGSASRETYDEPTEARLYPGSWAPAQFQGVEGGIAVRNWQILGPFGGPGAERFIADPPAPMKAAVKNFYEAATFPPDNGAVDLKATYSGAQINGYWPKIDAVRWKAAEISDLDPRITLGLGAQVWYGATWVYASKATELELEFQGHHQTQVRWALNGKPVEVGAYRDTDDATRTVANRTLALQAGWNQIYFRAYSLGYPPFRLGLILKGAPDTLWPLKFSNLPP